MKKQIVLHIDIDTEMVGLSRFKPGPAGNHEILIRRDSILGLESIPEKHDTLFCLTHELGHAVGLILELPGMTHDHRTPQFVHGKTLGESIVESESEAWDVAEIILEFNKYRKKCFGSYEQVYGPHQPHLFNEKSFYREVR